LIDNISVALASYNGEKYIEKQIKSILNQSRKVDRIVICDDNSKDGTIKIIEKLIKKGLPINLYKNEKNLGYALNFMKCINLCNSNYIFLSDQDDIWFKDKVELMMNFIKENPEYLCWIHDCTITNNCLEPIINSKLENIKRFGFNEKSFLMGACMVISKYTKKYIYPFPDDISDSGHDNWISNVVQSTNNLRIYKRCLIFYRRHVGITSKGDFNSIKNVNKLISIIIRIRKFLTEKKINNNSNKLIKRRNYNWSILIHQNYLNSKYKILKNYNIDTFHLALETTTSNFLKRFVIVCRLIKRGYYENRSGIFSILIDLFFPNA